MTVEELIKELSKMPKDKTVELGDPWTTHGGVARVIEYHDRVEIESDGNPSL